jgi:hypothetical protein
MKFIKITESYLATGKEHKYLTRERWINPEFITEIELGTDQYGVDSVTLYMHPRTLLKHDPIFDFQESKKLEGPSITLVHEGRQRFLDHFEVNVNHDKDRRSDITLKQDPLIVRQEKDVY